MNLYDTIVLPLIECQSAAYRATGYRPRIEITLDEDVYMTLLDGRSFDVRLISSGIPSEMKFGAHGDVVVKRRGRAIGGSGAGGGTVTVQP